MKGSTSIRVDAPPRRRIHLGTRGYLADFLFTFFVSVLARGSRLFIAIGVIVGLTLLIAPSALRLLRDWRFWLFPLILIASNLWILPADAYFHGIPYAQAGVNQGLQMSLRSIGIILGMQGLSRSISISEMAALLERVSRPGLGFALGVAINMLPLLQENAHNSFQALKMRGGLRHRRLQSLRLLFISVLVSTLRDAEDIVAAAQARAFRPDQAQRQALITSDQDKPLAIGLILLTALLIWPL